MRIYFVFLIVGLVFISFGSGLSMKHSIENNVILKEYGNSLNFILNVEGAEEGYYNVYTLSDSSILPSDVFYLSKSYFEKNFTIKPMERMLDFEGVYVIKYFLNHRNFEKYQNALLINILSMADVIEVKTEPINIDSDYINVSVRNLGGFSFENLNAGFSSFLFDFNHKFDLPSESHYSFRIPISNKDLKGMRAGVYLMDVSFESPKGPVVVSSNIYFNETGNIKTEDYEKGIIYRRTGISKENIGNTVEDVRIEIKRNIINRFFTSFNIEPMTTVREDFIVRYVWTKRLNPSESFSVQARTNYFYPFLIIISLVLLYIGLRRFFMAKAFVNKSVSSVKTKKGEFALRVSLRIKAKKSIKEVSLIDKVPRTVKVYKNFGISTPDEVDVATRRLKWDIGDLDAGEERYYSYIVYSRVGFLGKISLPPCFLKFKILNKVYYIESNSVFFLSEEQIE